ncbi:hypothetical protein Hdeb2414_s0028g00701631 [Helianthus debilis subsp. tardiflorus]
MARITSQSCLRFLEWFTCEVLLVGSQMDPSRLIGQLQVQQEGVGTIKVIDHIHLAMLSLSILMCFGEKLDDRRVNSIASVKGGLLSLVGSTMFYVVFVSPLLAKILFRNKWKKLDMLRSDQNQLLTPLIKS